MVYCYECDQYPCRVLKMVDKRYREKYGMSFIENLEFIRSKGMQAFLEEQRVRHQCPCCGEMRSVHNGQCFGCNSIKYMLIPVPKRSAPPASLKPRIDARLKVSPASDKYSLASLRKLSGLPGPRGNLELLHRFARECDQGMVDACLAVIKPDTANSPDEFVGMCGIVGHALLNWKKERSLIVHLRRFAVHSSWRLREAVAIALQEIPVDGLAARLRITAKLEMDDPFIQRAIIAGLCEPKNLGESRGLGGVFDHLKRATDRIDHEDRLSEGEEALRKALGYAWSVAIVASPEQGKRLFESLLPRASRHVRWVISENLKKKRLLKMDAPWVAGLV